MTVTDLGSAPPRPGNTPAGSAPRPNRRIGWDRVRRPSSWAALSVIAVAALGESAGTVVAGRLAEGPTARLVWLLALFLVGSAALDTVGRAVWSAVVDRAEGQLRADLLDAAMHQPLAVLSETAVGEILDRIDDDTHELGIWLRRMVWDLARTLVRVGPMWVVAGLTWWPAWLLFPAVAALMLRIIGPLTAEVGRLKVIEEEAWTDHAAAMEEGIAARDDLRTSLGQAYVLRRCAGLSATVHARVAATSQRASAIGRRAGVLLGSLLAAVGVAGTALVSGGRLSTASLITLFLVTSAFIGQIEQLTRHLPDLQYGLGSLTRLRQLLAVEPEPVGGRPVPPGPLSISVSGLSFRYPAGTFELTDVDLEVPAGSTTALVGRTGSGKSTLAAMLSRAVDPPRGAVRINGVDVLEVDLQQLRGAVGVVTQRTEILAATLLDNVTLFADVPRAEVLAAVDTLGLREWIDGLPDGVDTLLGPGGTTLSAGEEQLVAFARLLVRDVAVVVLDEATARMDPMTEERVVHAAERLLTGRTGLVVAHRLTTTKRADQVVVLDGGRVVQAGPRAALASTPGPFRALLDAAGDGGSSTPATSTAVDEDSLGRRGLGSARRSGPVPAEPDIGDGPSLARGTVHLMTMHRAWGLAGAGLFLVQALLGAFGVLTGLVWGRLVVSLQEGGTPYVEAAVLTASLLAAPVVLSVAMAIYPRWWTAVLLRVRFSVLLGQTMPHRLPPTPPGEVVARAMDSDRYARYADRWVDLLNGVAIVIVTAAAARSLLAGGVLLAVMVISAATSSLGSPLAGRSAAAASVARGQFGRALVSAMESARTVKLAAATPDLHRHLRSVDAGRVDAAVHEHRVQAILDGVPVVLVKCGVVAGWLVFLRGGWGLATALLVTTAVNGFDWFGRVAGAVITEAPGVRAWQRSTARLAGGVDLMDLPPGVDLVRGIAPDPAPVTPTRLERLEVRGFSAVHDDGTLGVEDIDLTVPAGQLVLLLGQVGSGKSSLLAALAGLVGHTGSLRWNGVEVADAQQFLRPGQVTHVAQVPRVLSGTFAGNIALDHARDVGTAIDDARLGRDVQDAGGLDAVVGHRGVRLSGGQVQRLALARALATGAELVLADDVSSALDAHTEVELWRSLRARGVTVVGATSKHAALREADAVVVLVDGAVAATGPWSALAPSWGHLAG